MQKLEKRVSKIESVLKEITDTVPKKKHVDLVEEVGADTEDLGSTITGEYKDEKEKANNEGSGGGGVKPNKRRKISKKSSNKS